MVLFTNNLVKEGGKLEARSLFIRLKLGLFLIRMGWKTWHRNSACAAKVRTGCSYLEFTFVLGEKAFDFGNVHFVWFSFVFAAAARTGRAVTEAQDGSISAGIGLQFDELCKFID